MARISINEADTNMQKSEQGWFSLKNDGDTARVQFVLDTYEDIQAYLVHKVPSGAGYEIKIDCLRSSYDDPLHKCPLCEAGHATATARYIAVYDKSDKKTKLWERGAKFYNALKPYFNRYNPLRNYVFDIQRQGKHGDRDTTYSIFPVIDEQADDISSKTFEVLGVGIRQWTTEQMKNYVETGNLPEYTSNNSNSSDTFTPVTRAVEATKMDEEIF